MRFHIFLLLPIVALTTAASAAARHSHHPPHRALHHAGLSDPSHDAATVPSDTSATLYFYLYSNSSCNTPQPRILNFYPSGQCIPNLNTSYAYFCDEEAGYFVDYSDNACQTPSMNEVVRYEFGCRADGQQAACVNPELGPPLPFTWPPENFIIQTLCTDGLGNSYCGPDAAAGIVCEYDGSIANVCVEFPNGKGSYINYCTEDGEWFGYAQYVSANCSEPVASMIQLSSTVCNATVSNTRCTGSPLSLTQYPSIGLVLYNDSSCAPSSTATTIGYHSPGACVDSMITTCDVSNGTLMQSWYGWSDPFCLGPNPQLSNSTVDQCIMNEIAFCNGAPIQI